MKTKLRTFLLALVVLTKANVFGQLKENRTHEIGINLMQIPATTIDLIYELSYNPSLTAVVNAGYTVNYASSFDFAGSFLSPHYKCANSGYSVDNQSGGFLKFGMKFNFRKTTDKKNYFYLGGYLTNTLVHEKAGYINPDIANGEPEQLNHTLFVIGLTVAAGYNVRISHKLDADFGLQISKPSNNYKNLYGYSNYIPGMGFMETCGNVKIFPLIVLNLKYKLR